MPVNGPPSLLTKVESMIQQYDNYPDLEGSRTAMIRAARNAAELAKRFHQPLLLWRDGQVVRVMPDDLPDLPAQTPDRTEQL